MHKEVQRRLKFCEIGSSMKLNRGTGNAQRIGTSPRLNAGGSRTAKNVSWRGYFCFFLLVLALPVCLGIAKAEARINHASQFLACDWHVCSKGSFLLFVYMFVYLFLFPFLTALHSHFSYCHYHQLFYSGSRLFLYVFVHFAYCCFPCMHFNFCKQHRFLDPTLFLTFYHCASCRSYSSIVPRVLHSWLWPDGPPLPSCHLNDGPRVTSNSLPHTWMPLWGGLLTVWDVHIFLLKTNWPTFSNTCLVDNTKM